MASLKQIPAALPSSTDVYGYDQTGDVPPQLHKGSSQTQQGVDGRLQQGYNDLYGQRQDDHLASSSASAITEVLREKRGSESHREERRPRSRPPSYNDLPQTWHISAIDGYGRGRAASQYPAHAAQSVPTAHVVVTQPVGNQLERNRPKDAPLSCLPLSIFACVCCFWPIGLVAIWFSLKTNEAIRRGDYEDARKKSHGALAMSLLSILVGVILLCIMIVLNKDYIF